MPWIPYLHWSWKGPSVPLTQPGHDLNVKDWSHLTPSRSPRQHSHGCSNWKLSLDWFIVSPSSSLIRVGHAYSEKSCCLFEVQIKLGILYFYLLDRAAFHSFIIILLYKLSTSLASYLKLLAKPQRVKAQLSDNSVSLSVQADCGWRQTQPHWADLTSNSWAQSSKGTLMLHREVFSLYVPSQCMLCILSLCFSPWIFYTFSFILILTVLLHWENQSTQKKFLDSSHHLYPIYFYPSMLAFRCYTDWGSANWGPWTQFRPLFLYSLPAKDAFYFLNG